MSASEWNCGIPSGATAAAHFAFFFAFFIALCMPSRPIAIIKDSARGIKLCQRGLKTFARSIRGDIRSISRDECLLERRRSHVEEFPRLVEFPLLITDVPLARQLIEDPFAGSSCFSAELESKTSSIQLQRARYLRARQFGKRGKEVARINEVGRDFSGRSHATPARNQRDQTTALEHRTLNPPTAGRQSSRDQRVHFRCRCRRRKWSGSSRAISTGRGIRNEKE